MAKIKRCPPPRDAIAYTLDLTEDEAIVLRLLAGAVPGQSHGTPREFADEVYDTLRDAGVPGGWPVEDGLDDYLVKGRVLFPEFRPFPASDD